MQPLIGIFDDFLRQPEDAAALVLAGTFSDYDSPYDGVVYPAINQKLPPAVEAEYLATLEFIFGRKPEMPTIFSRAMFEGMKAPNRIHSDVVMGKYAAHLYLSKDWPEGAGTSFWRHRDEGGVHLETTDLSKTDANDMSQWERVVTVQGRFNRLLIHHGNHWHLAEPIGGWGQEPGNARVVITCFFS